MQNSEKDEYRQYLEKSGVVDALTKVLVGLYEEQERPGNGLEWVKQHLGSVVGVDIEGLRRENDELKARNAELRKRVETLEAQLASKK